MLKTQKSFRSGGSAERTASQRLGRSDITSIVCPLSFVPKMTLSGFPRWCPSIESRLLSQPMRVPARAMDTRPRRGMADSSFRLRPRVEVKVLLLSLPIDSALDKARALARFTLSVSPNYLPGWMDSESFIVAMGISCSMAASMTSRSTTFGSGSA